MRNGSAIMTAVLVGTILSGCASGGGASEGKGAPVKAEEDAKIDLQTPVELVFYDEQNMSEDMFNERFAKPIKNKFPNVSFKVIKPGKGTYISEIAASGTLPDLYYTTAWSFPLQIDGGLIMNLEDAVKKDKIDLNGYQPTLIDTIKAFSPKGELYALPYSNYASVLYYNKDIFDRLAVPYPKDGMTYEDAIALGKQLTRTEGGVRYTGFFPGNYSFTYALFKSGFVDVANKKASFNNQEMRQTLELLKSGFSTQGIEYMDYTSALNLFYKEKTLAMIPYHFELGRLEGIVKSGEAFNWDFVQAPTLNGFNRSGAPSLLSVSSQTKHSALVFKIISYLSASTEYQTFLASKGVLPVIKNDEIMKSFGSSLDYLKGKHIEAIFMTKPQSMVKSTQFDRVPDKYLTQALKDVVTGVTDINTALNKAEEQANKDLLPQFK
ncbi:ABC transporter substrate-binding protein [Paenibacillus sp. NPDC056579]|uniref:ABC transporter substrate-binding protein n=1 Tax=unclassified Paenibacillus TaxID=185978 RepID=UPI001EF9ABFB|nr:extracellular solute-binding protein [Paenibacillus sp. H1-7]